MWVCDFTTEMQSIHFFFFFFYHFFLYSASRNAPQCLEPQNKTGGKKKQTLLQDQITQESEGAQTHDRLWKSLIILPLDTTTSLEVI